MMMVANGPFYVKTLVLRLLRLWGSLKIIFGPEQVLKIRACELPQRKLSNK
jgi:hypothetical protein